MPHEQQRKDVRFIERSIPEGCASLEEGDVYVYSRAQVPKDYVEHLIECASQIVVLARGRFPCTTTLNVSKAIRNKVVKRTNTVDSCKENV